MFVPKRVCRSYRHHNVVYLQYKTTVPGFQGIDILVKWAYNTYIMKTIPIAKSLIVLVGPSGSGKSHFSEKHFDAREIVSSDAIRQEFTGDFRRQDKNNEVFDEFHRRIEVKLNVGQRVIADATNIRNADRRRVAEIGKRLGVPVIYVVINRSWFEKDRDGGWRKVIRMKRGITLMDAHQTTFEANEKTILAGDGIADMVIDTRNEPFEVGQALTRDPKMLADQLVDRGFEFIRVIGDVHGNTDGLEQALAGVDDRGVTFPIFLGDIVDYGTGTLRAAEIVSSLVMLGQAACIRGNHERKINNYIVQERGDGFRGVLTHGNDTTTNQLQALAPDARLGWEERMLALVEASADWIQLDDRTLLTHGAGHPRMWDNTVHRANRNSSLESYALYGKTTGKTDPVTGFPERDTSWVDEIEARKTVIVGHSVLSVIAPVVMDGSQGGTAVFLDTGSSKDLDGNDGHLSWMDYKITPGKRGKVSRIEFDKFGRED